MQSENENHIENDDLALARLKGRVDELSSLKKDEKPWYQSPAIIVSLAAFIISLVTTVASAYRTYRQDVELQKSNLRSTLLQLSSLAIQAVDSSIKYKNDPALQGLLSVLNAQNSVLARQAYSLVTELGNSASAVDLGIVANSLLQIGESSSAQKLLMSGLERASNIGDYTFVARTLGAIKIGNGEIEEGNRYWNLAMNVSGKFPNESAAEGYLNFTHAITKLHWAGVLGGRDCNAAKLHFADAETYIAKGQNNPAAIAQRDQLQTYLRVACP